MLVFFFFFVNKPYSLVQASENVLSQHCTYIADTLIGRYKDMLFRYYCRYTDDIFVMLECDDHAKKFLRYMNFHHPNIQFTFEEVCNDKLNFLFIYQ